jgi:hypothetical protein
VLNPLSTPANTVDVVCLITFTLTKNEPASLTKNFPGSNINVRSLPYSAQKALNLF